MSIEKHAPGIRTRVLLLTSLVLIIAGTTASSLYIIRSQLRKQVQANLDTDLEHSVETFQDLEAGHLAALERENALMAALPSLKALMTTNDPRTIADDAVDFWKTSGNDLFALADSDRRIQVAYARDAANTDALQRDLQAVITDTSKHYLISGGRLFEYSMRPLYFGSPAAGTLLGYVISGYAIDPRFLREVGRGAGAEAVFLAGHVEIVSTLPNEKQHTPEELARLLRPDGSSAVVMVGHERYLTASKDLTGEAGTPLRLVVMKSFDAADRAEREINWLIFWVSLLVMAAGSVLMLLLARMVTRPLELLTAGVRAFGEGDRQHSLPLNGTQEVLYLSRVFAQMRDEIEKTNRALLESERLATIGRMASSVSHDLRHYLAAVYANAEFLASPTLPSSERADLYEEIRLAVNGTTDMLDSLLIFSRTGSALQRVPTPMFSLVDRAMGMVKSHPDAERVTVVLEKNDTDTTAAVDTKQVERAIYNLLLNACQSARESAGLREVRVSLRAESKTVSVTIVDSGPGVAEGIRESLFDPFVSQGKQKGTGLGLTLAWSVAREHDGGVKLVSSRAGETIFRMTVARHLPESPRTANRPRSRVLMP
ncbi:MAG TPA: HAMP domain-containing sensor histidine kinase [Terracidiphilus sp.]